jgi:hypothetical protein
MMLALAALATTLGPAILGSRWVDGPFIVRYGLGSLVGVALVGLGAIIGGLANALVPGVLVTCFAGWFLGPRLRFVVRGQSGAADPVRRNTLLFIIAIGACLMLLSIFRPIPAWDGWMQWSLKAKALALDGNFYGPVFASPAFNYSHQDYPTLLSAWQALAYLIGGQLTVSWPLQFQLAWLWTAGTLGLVGLLYSQWGRSALFVMAWVCAPALIYWVMAGYADVPMAFFLLAGVVVLLSPSPSPVIAGLLLGACALTKNEGLPLAILTVLSVSVFSVERKVPLQALGILLVVRLPWLLFTGLMGIPNDIVNAATLRPSRLIMLMPRLIPIGEAWVSELLAFKSWGILLFATCVGLILRWKPRADLIVASIASIAVLTFIYVVTPKNLAMQLVSSLERVAIAPLGLLAVSMATGKPGRSLTGLMHRKRFESSSVPTPRPSRETPTGERDKPALFVASDPVVHGLT